LLVQDQDQDEVSELKDQDVKTHDQGSEVPRTTLKTQENLKAKTDFQDQNFDTCVSRHLNTKNQVMRTPSLNYAFGIFP